MWTRHCSPLPSPARKPWRIRCWTAWWRSQRCSIYFIFLQWNITRPVSITGQSTCCQCNQPQHHKSTDGLLPHTRLAWSLEVDFVFVQFPEVSPHPWLQLYRIAVLAWMTVREVTLDLGGASGAVRGESDGPEAGGKGVGAHQGARSQWGSSPGGLSAGSHLRRLNA